MTGLERMIAKVSNATAQALMGNAVAVGTLDLEESRRQALEAEERRFEAMRQLGRRAIRWADD